MPHYNIFYQRGTKMKAVIPAAGLGTRLLPSTKAQPKEMLPIIDKPAIQYVVEEAVASGIDDILIITGKGKRAIEDHFDRNFELEQILERKGKYDELQRVRELSDLADIYYIRQKEPKGLGDAILCAEKYIGNESFAVLLGDDIIINEKPGIKQLMEVYYQFDVPVIGLEKVSEEEVSKYGIIKPGNMKSKSLFLIDDLIEKPSKDLAPSNYAAIGRYILIPEIFTYLKMTKVDSSGELQLTDALRSYNTSHRIYGLIIEGKRLDIGTLENWIMANIKLALADPKLREKIEELLSKV